MKIQGIVVFAVFLLLFSLAQGSFADEAKMIFWRGEFLWGRYKYEPALEFYRKLAHKFPESPYFDDAIYKLGYYYYLQGDYSKAEKYFGWCRDLKKETAARAVLMLSFCRARMGKASYAQHTLWALMRGYPGSGLADDAQYYLGYYWEAKKYFKRALREYRKVVKKFPKGDAGGNALWRMGRIYYKQKKYLDAYATFKEAVKSYPAAETAEECLFWQAKAAEKLRWRTKAQKLYQQLIDRYDHTYYAYRAREKLKLPPPQANLPLAENSQIDIPKHIFSDNDPEEIAFRAWVAIREAPQAEKEKLSFALSKALVDRGIYFDAIMCLEGKRRKLIRYGKTKELAKDLWKLSYPLAYWDHVQKYAQEFAVDPYLVLALLREESHFLPTAVSWAGARGLAQIMPATGKEIAGKLRLKKFKSEKLLEPELSIRMGAHYLGRMLKGFGGDKRLALAAYNGGGGSASRWWRGRGRVDMDEFIENIPYPETRRYVKKVMGSYFEYKRIYGKI